MSVGQTPKPALLPCPFCGGTAQFFSSGGRNWVFASCDKCAHSTADKDSFEDAAADWNRRVSPWKESSKEPPPKDGNQFLLKDSDGQVWIVDWADGSYWLDRGEPIDVEGCRWMLIPPTPLLEVTP